MHIVPRPCKCCCLIIIFQLFIFLCLPSQKKYSNSNGERVETPVHNKWKYESSGRIALIVESLVLYRLYYGEYFEEFFQLVPLSTFLYRTTQVTALEWSKYALELKVSVHPSSADRPNPGTALPSLPLKIPGPLSGA